MEKPLEGASLAQAEKNDCCSQGMRLFPMFLHMGVSKNRGYPQIMHFNRVFHYKPSILGGFSPYFWKHPHFAAIFFGPKLSEAL